MPVEVSRQVGKVRGYLPAFFITVVSILYVIITA